MRRAILLALLAALGVFAIAVLTKQPRQDLDWQTHLSRTPVLEQSGDDWVISPVRDWRYSGDGVAAETWQPSETLTVTALERVWLLLEPHPGYPMMAHTLVLFEFDDGQLIGLTIEARKEQNERFAPILGAMNRFELIYVWATPRDLLTRRAVMLGHELELYPLILTPEQEKAFLRSVLERSEALTQKPRFYNTFTSNCTNELAEAAGLAWDPAFVLTGGAAEALWKLGLIAGDSFETAQRRARITDRVIDASGHSHLQFNAGLIATSQDGSD